MPPKFPTDRAAVSDLLSSSLPAAEFTLLGEIAAEAARRSLPLYIVGGFVRDLLLGTPAQDFDLVVEGDAITLAKAVAVLHGGKVTAHSRFHTAQWFPPPVSGLPEFLDFITARSETYAHPGALPTVKAGSLEDDLRRRDFAINTLALRLDGDHFGELRDDLGGLEDLRDGLVRVLHPDSYRDDPTRILRAVRYEQRYAFRIAADDLERIASARPFLQGLSADRIRHELDLILDEPRAVAMLERLAGLDILAALHATLEWENGLKYSLENGLDAAPPTSWGLLPDLTQVPRRLAWGYLLWLTHLNPEEIRGLNERLHFPAALREALLSSSDLFRQAPGLTGRPPSAIVARLEKIPPLVLFANYKLAQPETGKIIDEYMAHWRHVQARVTGSDLVGLGLAPGPAFTRILSGLRNAWLDGTIHSEVEEREMLNKYLGDNNHV